MAQKMIKLVHGVPLPMSVSKEFIDILEANNIKDLDTGGSYVSFKLQSQAFKNQVANEA